MPETPVLAQSPLSLNVAGKHLMIPLSALYYDSKGELKADRWPLYAANQDAVDRLLTRLKKRGVIRPGRAPTAKPSFTATAVTPGASGVLVEIEITNVTPNTATPANSTANFKVTETDTYTVVEVSKLVEILGTATSKGKRPGLVVVSSTGTVELPRAGTYQLVGDPATVNIPKNTGTGDAFALRARSTGADGAATTVEIKDVDTARNTFTLIARWTKSATALAMTGLAAAFAYATTITAPPGGFLAPAAGKTVLTGGSDAVAIDAVKASTTVVAG